MMEKECAYKRRRINEQAQRKGDDRLHQLTYGKQAGGEPIYVGGVKGYPDTKGTSKGDKGKADGKSKSKGDKGKDKGKGKGSWKGADAPNGKNHDGTKGKGKGKRDAKAAGKGKPNAPSTQAQGMQCKRCANTNHNTADCRITEALWCHKCEKSGNHNTSAHKLRFPNEKVTEHKRSETPTRHDQKPPASQRSPSKDSDGRTPKGGGKGDRRSGKGGKSDRKGKGKGKGKSQSPSKGGSRTPGGTSWSQIPTNRDWIVRGTSVDSYNKVTKRYNPCYNFSKHKTCKDGDQCPYTHGADDKRIMRNHQRAGKPPGYSRQNAAQRQPRSDATPRQRASGRKDKD